MLNSLQGRDMHKSVANDDQPERLYKSVAVVTCLVRGIACKAVLSEAVMYVGE